MDEESSKTLSRREKRKEQTRQRLLEAAEQLFRRQGYDATTVEEIAETADVAKGTFFNYFENKDSLLGAILQKRIYPMMSSPPGEGQPAPERIELLLKALWNEFHPYRHMARRMLAHAMTHPHLASRAQEQPPLAKTFANLVHEGQGFGDFRPSINAETAGILITGFFFRIFIQACSSEIVDSQCPDTIIKENLDMIYYGLLSPSK